MCTVSYVNTYISHVTNRTVRFWCGIALKTLPANPMSWLCYMKREFTMWKFVSLIAPASMLWGLANGQMMWVNINFPKHTSQVWTDDFLLYTPHVVMFPTTPDRCSILWQTSSNSTPYFLFPWSMGELCQLTHFRGTVCWCTQSQKRIWANSWYEIWLPID